MKSESKRLIKVKMPRWWTDQAADDTSYIVGYTDGKDTYCASAIPCWYVSVPAFEYEGYFGKEDLEVVDGE
jgi:hypothetical protein